MLVPINPGYIINEVSSQLRLVAEYWQAIIQANTAAFHWHIYESLYRKELTG